MSESSKQAKILTIDDEKPIRDSFRYFLEDRDFVVVEAENGQIGIEKFKKENPDLILLDFRMPEMDGLQVLENVTAEAPEIPIIVVSGTGAITDVVDALHLGAWDYLLKPIQDMSVLEHAVNKALERADLIRENNEYQEQLEEKVAHRTRELMTTTKALENSEYKYRMLAENTGDVIWSLDDNLDCTYISPSIHRLCGYHSDECLKNKFVKLMTPDSYKVFQKSVKKEIRESQPLHDTNTNRSITVELEMVNKNGSTVWTEVQLSLLSQKERPTFGIIGVSRNIQYRKILETQLRQAQKMEAIGTLAGGIAHDFNNILSAIMGYTQIATLHLNNRSGKALGSLEKVMKAGDRARDLVSQILSFSRHTENRRQPVRIRPVIKEALKLLRASLPTTIEIRQNIKTDLDTIEADSTQIHQVLMNLCTNSHHAMRKKGGILEVTLSTIKVNNFNMNTLHDLVPGLYLKLSISDTGHGIDSNILERIFDPYYTTKQKGEGTGLGLAVVHGIIKSHDGIITVDSEIDKGTTFHIYFPSIEETIHNEKIETNIPLPIGNENILYIDDEISLSDIGEEMLEYLGYNVVTETSSVKALDLFRENPEKFDLVITDMTMPMMTGDKLAKKIMEIRPDIPVILCTGFSETITPENAKSMGIRAFIMKPITMSKIAKTLRKVLE